MGKVFADPAAIETTTAHEKVRRYSGPRRSLAIANRTRSAFIQGVTILPSTHRQRVLLQDQRFQPLIQDMRINLGGRDVGMAQKRLDHAQIRTVLQQVSRCLLYTSPSPRDRG